MNKCLSWIRRGPVGLWVFLALTQALALVAAFNHISVANHNREDRIRSREKFSVLEFHTGPGDPYDDSHVQQMEQKYLRREWSKLVFASVMFPTFAALAYWKWRLTKQEAVTTAQKQDAPGRTQDAKPPG